MTIFFFNLLIQANEDDLMIMVDAAFASAYDYLSIYNNHGNINESLHSSYIPVLITISCPTKRRDITVSPSSCTDNIPSALRAVLPSAANCLNFDAASFGMESVTRTLFHGSTCVMWTKTIFDKISHRTLTLTITLLHPSDKWPIWTKKKNITPVPCSL